MEKFLYNEPGPTGKIYEKGEWKEFVIHSEKEIKGFFGEYRFLSNFGSAKINFENVSYSSVEIAYQAAKWKPEDRKYFLSCTSLEAIKYNRDNVPNGYAKDEWDAMKEEIMYSLCRQKFDPNLNPENYEKLIAIGDKHLEEMNWWGDTYWGTDKDGNGQNMLGKILMRIREEI